jgi:hypothetical protein
MKTLAISLLFLFIINLSTKAQIKDTTDFIIEPFEQYPIFPGSFDSLWCFLESNFRYEILNSDNKKIKYFIRFMIDTVGKAKNFEILATLPRDVILGNSDSVKISEIFRVFELMPTWQPAKQDNKKVKCWYTLPVMTPYTKFMCRQFQNKRNNQNLLEFNNNKNK